MAHALDWERWMADSPVPICKHFLSFIERFFSSGGESRGWFFTGKCRQTNYNRWDKEENYCVHANNTCDFVMWPLRDMLLLFLDIYSPSSLYSCQRSSSSESKKCFLKSTAPPHIAAISQNIFGSEKKYEKLSKQYSTSCCCCCSSSGKTIK